MEHDVARLQIPMDDAGAVRCVKRGGNLDRIAQDVIDRQRTFAQGVGQRVAVEIT